MNFQICKVVILIDSGITSAVNTPLPIVVAVKHTPLTATESPIFKSLNILFPRIVMAKDLGPF